MDVIKQDFDKTFRVDAPNSEPILIEKCWFANVPIGRFVKEIDKKFTIKDITLNKCKVGSVSIGMINFKNVIIDGLTCSREISINNALFEKCVLKGKIGKIMFCDWAVDDELVNKKVLEYNDKKYKEMDWALDISEAEFTEFDCRSIPAEKIRINKETQFAVDYNNLKSIKDHPEEFIGRVKINLECNEVTEYNFIIAPCKRAKRYERDMAFVEYLKSINCILE